MKTKMAQMIEALPNESVADIAEFISTADDSLSVHQLISDYAENYHPGTTDEDDL